MAQTEPEPNPPPETAITKPASAQPAPADGKNAPANQGQESGAGLSPEEQLALYEEELKQTDWGHQPC